MLKVSFKEDYQKVQVFNDRATIVTVVGQMVIPWEVWDMVPSKISVWMWHHPSVSVNTSYSNEEYKVINLESSGKSICAKDDTFDAEIGRRIAESRAKIRLYKFMYKLLDQLCDYYGKLLVGYKGFNSASINGSLLSELEKYQALWVKESHHLGKLLEDA